MQYGINEFESFFNYQKMCSDLEKYMVEGEKTDIILDITHSFRSMPIYYFLVINYLMHISSQDVNVSAIYYGMFELKKEEMLDYIPVINMNYLIDTMNWINGLNEVNSYGSVYGVTKCLGENNDISDWLQIFEWATNTNDYSLLTKSIAQITAADISQDTYSVMGQDALKMIRNLLQSKFSEKSERNVSLMQLELSQWFYEQRRYGLAILTIQECVTTYITYLILKYWDKKQDTMTMEDCKQLLFEEGTRRRSIGLLRMIAAKEPNAQKLLCFYDAGKGMRNTMAHVFNNVDTGKKTSKVLLQEILHQRKRLKQYIDLVEDCITHDSLREEVQRQALSKDGEGEITENE